MYIYTWVPRGRREGGAGIAEDAVAVVLLVAEAPRDMVRRLGKALVNNKSM